MDLHRLQQSVFKTTVARMSQLFHIEAKTQQRTYNTTVQQHHIKRYELLCCHCIVASLWEISTYWPSYKTLFLLQLIN